MTHGVDGPGVKRAFDLVSAGAALVMLSPLMALVAVVVRVSLGSPVLFRQRRPGLGGTTFEILKSKNRHCCESTSKADAFGRCDKCL